jgi:hypothetical protein
MAAAMIGVGEAFFAGERMSAAAALAKAGLEPAVLGPKEGLALLNGTQFSTANALAGLFAAETLFPGRAGHRRAVDRGRQRIGRAIRSAHPPAAPPAGPDRGGRCPAR